MPTVWAGPELRPKRCQFREETARCVFVDGHPGCHVCVRAGGAEVPIRGEGRVPDVEYLCGPQALNLTPRRIPGSALAPVPQPRSRWTWSMVRRLVRELHDAHVESPHDWSANIARLSKEAAPPPKVSDP